MKPLDFGDGGVTGSINADGRIIALNFYHPQHGYVTLTSADPFPEGERYSPAAVRAYRASLAALDGFGTYVGEPSSRSLKLLESAVPEIKLHFAEGDASVTTFATARGAVQTLAIPPGLTARWRGRLCLQRCAYTQLTEGGPLPMPRLHLRVFGHDGLLVVHNPELGAAVAIAGLDVPACGEQEADQPIELDFPLNGVVLAYGIGLTVETAAENARWLLDHADVDAMVANWRMLLGGLSDDPVLRRGVVYGRMMAVPVGEGVCLLTDHMLLPLSWNRDAYFVARALLNAGQTEVVRRHLLWTFETAERRAGMWARCYLANGRVKDAAFQLDQQLYPLLELAEYFRATGDRDTFARLRPQIAPLLAALDSLRSSDAHLFPTDETPGDDPIALPYHFSSHVLLWHTLNTLKAFGVAGHWAARLPDLCEGIRKAFTAERNGERLYAYATDGAGHFHFYHDANDFPVALAPAWGFVPADDAVWQATVAFAFSAANADGFYKGHLGSVHTPAPWALGDVQELIISRAQGDGAREKRAKAHLRAAAQFDGALPEAYDAETGAVVSRYWFAWPGAAYACAELGAFDPEPWL